MEIGINRKWPYVLRWAYILIASFSGLGLLAKALLLSRLLNLPVLVVSVLLAAALCLPLFWAVAFRFRFVLAPAVMLTLLVAFFVAFPKIESLHSSGRGTDQPDCVIVAARNLMSGAWPYQSSEMWTKNPMSCGPGWVALQAPAIETVGYSGNMLLLWAACLVVLGCAAGWSATAGMLALVSLSPAFWLAAANGSDFLTFGIAALALFAALQRFGSTAKVRVPLGLIAGLLGQFRVATLLLPAFLTKWLGRKMAFVATLFSLGIEAGFIVWNAPGFIADGPLHIALKLTNHHIFSTQPMLALLELLVPLMVVASALIFFTGRIRPKFNLVLYFAVIFILPALLDLPKKKHLYGNYTDMLQYWEGALWLSACLPLFAFLLVEQRARSSAKVIIHSESHARHIA